MPTRKSQIKQDPIVTAFAERLRELRAARGLTQKQLAGAAKVTLSYVSKLESAGAAPGLDLMQRLATALGVEISDFLPKVAMGDLVEQKASARRLLEEIISKSGDQTLAAIIALLVRMSNSPLLGN